MRARAAGTRSRRSGVPSSISRERRAHRRGDRRPTRPDVLVSVAAYTAGRQGGERARAGIRGQRGGRASRRPGGSAPRRPATSTCRRTMFSTARRQSPYSKAIPPGPTGVYGASKLAGERAVLCRAGQQRGYCEPHGSTARSARTSSRRCCGLQPIAGRSAWFADLPAIGCKPQHGLDEVRTKQAVTRQSAILRNCPARPGQLRSPASFDAPSTPQPARSGRLRCRATVWRRQKVIRGQVDQRDARLPRGPRSRSPLVDRKCQLGLALGLINLSICGGGHRNVRPGRRDRDFNVARHREIELWAPERDNFDPPAGTAFDQGPRDLPSRPVTTRRMPA